MSRPTFTVDNIYVLLHLSAGLLLVLEYFYTGICTIIGCADNTKTFYSTAAATI